jgi:hypothetical protein
MSQGLDSRVRVVDRSIDEQIVHQNGHYVCLMKLFPMCGIKGEVGYEDFSRFHLRYYLPRAFLADKSAKVDRLVIMANGLDELGHFTLYDELGSRLASRGIASVLLPLPDHLNRHMRFRMRNPTVYQLTVKPSEILMTEPLALHERFLQYRQEVSILLDHVRGARCSGDDKSCSFYRHVFSPRTRVSVLGYSLGAAAMLSNFLERLEDTQSDSDSINTCILLSAAVTLRNTRPIRMFDERQWLEYVRQLENAYSNLHVFPQGTEVASRLFGAVCFGHQMYRVQELLKLHGRRFLFIYGGRDSITGADKLKDLVPENWGVSLLALPGINHFLAVDEEWKKWIGLVSNLIADFDENGTKTSITEKFALQETSVSLDEASVVAAKQESLNNVVLRSKLLGYDLELAREREVEKDQGKKIDREKLLKALRQFAPETDFSKASPDFVRSTADFLRDKKIGQVLFALDLITGRDLARAVDRQRRLAREGTPKQIGSILVDDLDVLPRVHFEAIRSALQRSKEHLVS